MSKKLNVNNLCGGILARIGQGVRNIANRFRVNPAQGGIF